MIREFGEEYQASVKQLQGEYFKCFEKVETYIDAIAIWNKEDKYDCLQQILDDFLSAQQEGREISRVTGKDIRDYCKNMILAESERRDKRIYFAHQTIFTIAGILIIIFLRAWFLSETGTSIRTSLRFGIYELALFIISWVYYLMNYIASRILAEHPKILRISSRIIYLLFIWFIILFINKPHGKVFFTIPFPIFLVVLIPSIGVSVFLAKLERKNKKLSVYMEEIQEDQIAQYRCPSCGKYHDCDYSRCPYCKYEYNERNN